MRSAIAALGLGLLTACPGPLFGGNRTMGEECDDSDQCVDEGTCLRGVCAAYDCATDTDCENDHVCADVAGVMACALPCEADADCAGQQQCLEQDEGSFCL